MPQLKRATDLVQRPIFGAPWQGITSIPSEKDISPTAFTDAQNFLSRNGRVISRPPFQSFPSPPDGNPIKLAVTFQDALNNYHTFIATQATAYFLTSGPTYNALSPALTGSGNYPYGWVSLLRKLFFSNPGQPVSYVNGSANVANAVSDQGPSGLTGGFSARFLTTIAQHLVTAYTTEPAPGQSTAAVYPYRVRWSDSGAPTVWTPGPPGDAGYNDVVGVQDSITGLFNLGYMGGFLLREKGVTQIQATGNGQAPFAFYDLDIAPTGVGFPYPYSNVAYGTQIVGVGTDNVYTFNGLTFNPIGGNCVDLIFADLANTTNVDGVVGRIVPIWFGGFVYVCYILSIPGVNHAWCYSFNDNAWGKIAYGSSFFTEIAMVATA